MATDLDRVIKTPGVLEQITERLGQWWTKLSPFFNEYEEYADSYRLVEKKRTSPSQSPRTRVGETIRATEALTTSIYRMQTAQDPAYDLVSMNASQTAQELFNAHMLLRWQDGVTRYKKNLLRADRGCVLFGTQFVETPWIREMRHGRLLWESLGFVPRSLLQTAFDATLLSLDRLPWIAFIDYMNEDQLLDLSETDPDNWNPAQIQKAITDYKGAAMSTYSQNLQNRRQKAGYMDGPDYEVVTYYGRLRDLRRADNRAWGLRIINEQIPVSAFGNPSPTGKLPYHAATLLDFELEPLGRGVGSLGKVAQRELDSNRSDYSGIEKMALMNMWIKTKMSGVRNADLRVRPLGVIEVDDLNSLKPHSPDLRAIEYGLKIEEVYRSEHQGNTGAVPGLQAQTTDVSATEAGIAQNEAIRRVAVMAEGMSESFVGDHQQEKHDYNRDWFEPDLFLAVTNQPKPTRVNRFNIARDVAAVVKMVTDKDFRPQRLKNIMTAIQILGSIRQRPNLRIDDTQLYEEAFRALDINPKLIIHEDNDLSKQSVLNFMLQARQNAVNARGELGGDIAAESEGVVDNAMTPVGEIGLTP